MVSTFCQGNLSRSRSCPPYCRLRSMYSPGFGMQNPILLAAAHLSFSLALASRFRHLYYYACPRGQGCCWIYGVTQEICTKAPPYVCPSDASHIFKKRATTTTKYQSPTTIYAPDTASNGLESALPHFNAPLLPVSDHAICGLLWNFAESHWSQRKHAITKKMETMK